MTRCGLHAEEHDIPGLRIREDSMLDEGICVEKAPTAANRTPTATASFRVRIPVIWQEFIEATRGSREARHCAAGLRRLLRPREALPFGQVYATLARLARDRKVLAADTEPGSGPDRKRYVITDEGTTEVAAWLAEAVPPEPHLQSVLFVKIVLALMSGRSAEHYLDTQRAAHLQRMRELTN